MLACRGRPPARPGVDKSGPSPLNKLNDTGVFRYFTHYEESFRLCLLR